MTDRELLGEGNKVKPQGLCTALEPQASREPNWTHPLPIE